MTDRFGMQNTNNAEQQTGIFGSASGSSTVIHVFQLVLSGLS